MHEPLTLEARLAEALKRYSDAAPMDVEALSYARAVAEKRRPWTLWRAVPRSGPVLAAVLLVVALVTGAFAVGGRLLPVASTQLPGPTVAPTQSPAPTVAPTTQSPAPTVAPTQSPSPTAAPTVATPTPSLAITFEEPFQYSIPAGISLEQLHPLSGLFQFIEGSQSWYGVDEAGASPEARGVTVASARYAVVHPCPGVDGGPSRVGIRAAPADFLEDLAGIAGVTHGPVSTATLDGRVALRTNIDPAEARCDYGDFHVQGGSVGVKDYVLLHLPGQLLVADVEGDTVVIHIWAETEPALASWLPIATQLVDSFHFIGWPGASPTP